MEIQQELLEFHRFAQQRLSAGGSGTLQDLLNEWNTRHSYDRSVARIQKSMRQYAAGYGLPINAAFEEIRSKLGGEA